MIISLTITRKEPKNAKFFATLYCLLHIFIERGLDREIDNLAGKI